MIQGQFQKEVNLEIRQNQECIVLFYFIINSYEIQREIQPNPKTKSKDNFIEYLENLLFEIRSKDFIIENDINKMKEKEKDLETHKKLYIETTQQNKSMYSQTNNRKIEEMKEKLIHYIDEYYTVYSGIDATKNLLNEVEKLEIDKQEKKLSDRIEKIEVFIIISIVDNRNLLKNMKKRKMKRQ